MLGAVWITSLFLWPSLLLAELVNVTFDDSSGPDQHQASISYSPAAAWADAAGCSGCFAKPDQAIAFDGTYHHTTHDTQIDTVPTLFTFKFKGTGVYVYCVLANSLGSATGTKADYIFTLDNNVVGHFVHAPEATSAYMYNVTVYANSSIPDGEHTLIANVNGGAGPQGSSLMLLDWIAYTMDDGVVTSKPNSTSSGDPSNSTSSTGGSKPNGTSPNDPSKGGSNTPPGSSDDPTVVGSNSKSNTAAIAGGTVGGVVLLLIIILLFVWFRRRSRKREIENEIFWKSAPSIYDQNAMVATSEVPYSPYNTGTIDSQNARAPQLVEVDSRLQAVEEAIRNLSNQSTTAPSTSSQFTSPPPQSSQALQKQIMSLQSELARLREQQAGVVGDSRPPEYRA